MNEPELKIVPCFYAIISYPAKELPKAYEAMIFAKWLRSLRTGNKFFGKADPEQYYKNYHLYIEALLAKPDSLIRLAVLSDDHDIALGFSVSREDVLDYIYVHKDHRRQGIAKKLMPIGITTVSHTTETADRIMKRKNYKHLILKPWI